MNLTKKIPVLVICITLLMFTIMKDVHGKKLNNQTEIQRNKRIFISDLHLGDARSIKNNYCWFNKNIFLLERFLREKLHDPKVSEVIIVGDLLDEWVCPAENSPVSGKNTSFQFHNIAKAPQNKEIIKLLKKIADKPGMDLIYIHGNHDMFLTKKIIKKIIPGIKYHGSVYHTDDGIAAEHGHRHDIYNAKNSVSQPGHHLPLGYFITRAVTRNHPSKQDRQTTILAIGKASKKSHGMKLFKSGLFDFPMDVYKLILLDKKRKTSDTVVMDGIDNYKNKPTFKDVEKMFPYTTHKWNKIKAPGVVTDWKRALLDGTSLKPNLSIAAWHQYFKNPEEASRTNIVVFGHTHGAVITNTSSLLKRSIFKGKGKISKHVYANTGSWVDPDYNGKKKNKCTYVEIETETINNENGTTKINHVRLFDYKDNNKKLGEYSVKAMGKHK
ncbi:metallophosphoesterase [bacterium]|nr:metallophosphoesterase [bacterium]